MITVQPGSFGPRAVLRGPWLPSVAREMQAAGCVELELNDGKGWRGENLDFLDNLPWLQSIEVIDLALKSAAGVHALKGLKSLHLITYCDTPIQFDAFPQLQACSLEWRKGSDTLFRSSRLTDLWLNGFVDADLRRFSQLVNLQTLALLNAPVESLLGIEKLPLLTQVELSNLKRLRSLDGIEGLQLLESLEVHGCPKISDLTPVGTLKRLKTLLIPSNGEIGSIRPLSPLGLLEKVIFYESTNVKDGDLTPLLNLPRLAVVAFQERRHYNLKRDHFRARGVEA